MKPARTRALYAGSFDPITRGHLDIVQKALTTFDVVHIAVGANPLKTGLFDVGQRLELIRDSVMDLDLAGAGGRALPEQVEVGSYVGESVIKYARRIGATHVVRGLRQASDFDDEFRYHGVFGRLDATIPMVHFICQETFLHVSSSTARELASLNEDVSWLVTPSVERALRKKFSG
ncbi:pantetheine-phosphate adenylyltransferase [Phenylobacterium terrae]|uniref:Phosphopantetheine adenylyltransferase n=1 Tax=Phenylobacterium terrae TaxID=2665495 RepID=A0ABW4MXF3_9CAUL